MKKVMRRTVSLLMMLVLLAGFMPRKAEAAVRLNKTTVTVGINQTVTLKVTGTSSKVKWKSSNNKIATVSSKGIVKGKKKGTVTITAEVKKKNYKCRVTVIQPVTGVKLNRTRASLKTGGTISLSASVSPATATYKNVTWRSSNTKVATVTSKGTVKAIGKGTAVISATAKDGSGKKAACTVTVTQPVIGIKTHTHTWVDVTKTVHHDEKSHTEKKQVGTKTIVDQEAWDEDVYKLKTTCSACGYSSENGEKVAEHCVDVHDGKASHSTERVKVDTIHHDAVTHEEPVYEDVKVVDEEAWDETVVTGQKCSGCGATR